MSDITTSTTQAHVKGFVTSYAKCWEHYQGYMQDPSNTIQGFIEECQEEAELQGLDLHLPALKTFKNKTTKLRQAGVIPERLKSDKASAVSMRKQRATSQSPKSGQCEQPDDSSSPLIHPEVLNHVSDVQPGNTSTSISGGVSNVQSTMDSDYNRCDKDFVSMGTTDDRGAAEDLEEIVRLLNRVGLLTARNCNITKQHFTEEQWYLVWASLDSEAREAKMRCRNYEAAIQRDCAAIRAGAQARFGSGMGSDAAVL